MTTTKKGKTEVIEHQFSSMKEMYYWISNTNMDVVKNEMDNKYKAKTQGRIDLEKMQFIISY